MPSIYPSMSPEELINLLLTEENRLPREAALEIVRRGSKMVPLLSEIVKKQWNWCKELPEW